MLIVKTVYSDDYYVVNCIVTPQYGFELLGVFLYLGEVIHTLLESVHDDVIQLCQSF